MDRDSFRNISHLDLVKLNRIKDSLCECIRLLSANFLMLKLLHTCTYRSMTYDIHLMLAIMSITGSAVQNE